MHARVRSYRAGRLPRETIYHSGRQMLAALSRISGFVSFVMLDAGPGGLTCVYVCDGLTAVAEADRVTDRWLSEQQASIDGDISETTSGEVVLQRGL